MAVSPHDDCPVGAWLWSSSTTAKTTGTVRRLARVLVNACLPDNRQTFATPDHQETFR